MSLFTDLSDYILDQVFGFQDANEIKNNTLSLRDAVSLEHDWNANDSSPSADHGKHSEDVIGTHALNIGIDSYTLTGNFDYTTDSVLFTHLLDSSKHYYKAVIRTIEHELASTVTSRSYITQGATVAANVPTATDNYLELYLFTTVSNYMALGVEVVVDVYYFEE